MLKVQEIRELIKLIDESSISDFTYEANGTKVTLKKEYGEVVTVEQPKQPKRTETVQSSEPKIEQPVEKSNQVETKEEQAEEPKVSDVNYDYEITSPMVGTFYAAPSPDDGPYVHVGDQVEANTVVCIVEAMKLFNEIEAEVKGEIVEKLAEDGELVEYGQPLFRVKKK